MTSRHTPAPDPVGLLSLDQWSELPEDELGRSELQEGVLIVSPRPRRRHQDTLGGLYTVVQAALPSDLHAIMEIDVIIDAGFPPTVRVPDLVVVPAEAGEPLHAHDVVLAVEIVSPGSARLDTVTKLSEYAEAGIRHYWIIRPDRTLSSFTLVDGEYVGVTHAIGTFTATEPFPVTVDLTRL